MFPLARQLLKHACQGVNASVNKQAGCQSPEISLATCPPVTPLRTAYTVKRGGIPCRSIVPACWLLLLPEGRSETWSVPIRAQGKGHKGRETRMLLRVPLFLPAFAALVLCQLCSFNSLQKHKSSVLSITQRHTNSCRFQSWWASTSGNTTNYMRSESSHFQ